MDERWIPQYLIQQNQLYSYQMQQSQVPQYQTQPYQNYPYQMQAYQLQPCQIQHNQTNQSQTNQNQSQGNQANTSEQSRCLTPISYAGNIFLLGLIALVSELINQQAGAVLEVLMSPFNNDNGSNLEQDVLGNSLETVLEEDTFFDYTGS